ncbi:hypothetical protein BKA70DRAFT_1249503 [Coprinopsis sp. MPI-PUGE-AT-0042]|nr:hypothetical protein BKA70DRAFT_1249503 [Coprinopsis sp. MPI-PUGE-AT-0042]
MPRSRGPTPNASPFIPPLATPQSEHPPLAPVIPGYSQGGSPNQFAGGLPNTASVPWSAGMYPPPSHYPAFSPAAVNTPFFQPTTPAWPPAMGAPLPGQPPGVSAEYIGYGHINTPAAGNMPLGGMWGGPTSAPPAAGYPGAAQAQAQAVQAAQMQAMQQAQMQQAQRQFGAPPAGYAPFGAPPVSAPGFPNQASGWPSGGGMPWATPAAPVQPQLAPGDPWGLGAAMGGLSMGGMAMGGMGMGGMGMDPGHQPPQPSHRASQLDTMNVDRVDKFASGKHYGPVLSPFLVHVLKIKLEVNPLILPSLSGPERPTLKWNMLFASNSAYLSSDPPTKSCHFPRVTELSLASSLMTFPWLIRIKADDPALGVTCGEVIRALSKELQKNTTQSDWKWLQHFPNGQDLQGKVGQSWKHNRSTSMGVPGGELGQGMRRLDFLQDWCWWDGIELVDTHDPEGRELMKRVLSTSNVPGGKGLPCVFVFRSEQRQMRSQRDHSEFAEAARAGQQRPGMSRSASRSGRTSARPMSRAPSSQGGQGHGGRAPSRQGQGRAPSRNREGHIQVESPSDEEETDSDESSGHGTGAPRQRYRG